VIVGLLQEEMVISFSAGVTSLNNVTGLRKFCGAYHAIRNKFRILQLSAHDHRVNFLNQLAVRKAGRRPESSPTTGKVPRYSATATVVCLSVRAG
jgi:hypothetical protein